MRHKTLIYTILRLTLILSALWFVWQVFMEYEYILISEYDAISPGLYFLNSLTARNTADLLSIMGIPASSQGIDTYLQLSQMETFRMNIGIVCTPFLLFIVFYAVVLALPRLTATERLTGIIIGTISIYTGNVMRITAILMAGYFGGDVGYRVAHHLFFDWWLIFWSFFTFVFWLQMADGLRGFRDVDLV